MLLHLQHVSAAIGIQNPDLEVSAAVIASQRMGLHHHHLAVTDILRREQLNPESLVDNVVALKHLAGAHSNLVALNKDLDQAPVKDRVLRHVVGVDKDQIAKGILLGVLEIVRKVSNINCKVFMTDLVYRIFNQRLVSLPLLPPFFQGHPFFFSFLN